MKLEPLGDNILVRRETEADVTDGGIIIPECAKAKSIVVTILQVGEGRLLPSGKTVKPKVKPDDVVVIGKYCGSEFEYGGQVYLVIKEGDIQVRVKGK